MLLSLKPLPAGELAVDAHALRVSPTAGFDLDLLAEKARLLAGLCEQRSGRPSGAPVEKGKSDEVDRLALLGDDQVEELDRIVRGPRPERRKGKRFYVASRFEDFRRARAAIAALTERGHEVTYDWTLMADQYPVGGREAPRQVNREQAGRDLNGVREADFVLVLTAETGGCGMWIEMGAALALEIPLVLAGPNHNRSIFSELAEERFDRDDFAIEYCIARWHPT